VARPASSVEDPHKPIYADPDPSLSINADPDSRSGSRHRITKKIEIESILHIYPVFFFD